MLIHQELKLDKDKVRLRSVTEDDGVARAARERRRELGREGNPKGYSAGRSLAHVAMIPEDVYHFDPLCREYQRLRAAGNPEEAKRVLRLFLGMNPQYRCSETNL
ncbi:MAG: hypothetical protein P4N41_16705 [Negativicutes bacterium]|nr:hypothetical protein [Negativicutes bacterium]MDR3591296.1 hypothetical protein [Negativicutes bacterium]